MTQASEAELWPEVPRGLAALLGVSVDELESSIQQRVGKKWADVVVKWGDKTFVIECKKSGDAAVVAMAARQARVYAQALHKKAIPLVAVPFMGEAGRRMCEEEVVGWLDFSGNARLFVPGLRVHIEGKPNRFKRVGRPRSLFAPKSARVARWLLMRHNQTFSQRELARLSGLDEGFTSRIVRGLEAQELIRRQPDGTVAVASYDALLDAWREAYAFSSHRIVRGHVAARSSDEMLRRLADSLQSEGVKYAATGLAGAWLWSGFAGFRLVTLFVAELPDENARGRMGFHEMERGENVWLVRPNDEGVFHGSEFREEITCAHPVQIYLDLKGHPERSTEAAETLRKQFLKSTANA